MEYEWSDFEMAWVRCCGGPQSWCGGNSRQRVTVETPCRAGEASRTMDWLCCISFLGSGEAYRSGYLQDCQEETHSSFAWCLSFFFQERLLSLHLAPLPPGFGRVLLPFSSVWESWIKAESLACTSVTVGLNEWSIPSPVLHSLLIALPFRIKLFRVVWVSWGKKPLLSVRLNSQCLQEKCRG